MHTFIILILVIVLFDTSHAIAGQNGIPIMLPTEMSQQDDDPLNGLKKEYYPNGKVCKEYTLKDGKIEGSYKFYNMVGKLVSDQYFKDGEPNGYLKTYYENGQLKSEGNMGPEGDVSGLSKEYYEEGMLKKESNLTGQAPKFTGETKTYAKDGQLINITTIAQGEFVYSVTYDGQGRVTWEDTPGRSIHYWYEEQTGKKHMSINGESQY